MGQIDRIEREIYLNKIISRRENGLIKIVTGIRKCGKSYLLNPIYTDYLKSTGVKEDHIIIIQLDITENVKYHNDPEGLNNYINSQIKDRNMYYVILDEIQKVKNFEYLLNGLLYKENLDIYVAGSNSKFLSSDIITEFRGRGDQIRVLPFSYSEFLLAFKGKKDDAWNEYMTYGGLPLVLSKKNDEEKSQYLKEEKSQYLKEQFEKNYLSDIIERNAIQRIDILDSLFNMLASSVGSLTNPQKLYSTFKSNGEKELSLNTINSYIKNIEDSFIVNKANRYDIKGKNIYKLHKNIILQTLGYEMRD